jgi:hypothetical protein
MRTIGVQCILVGITCNDKSHRLLRSVVFLLIVDYHESDLSSRLVQRMNRVHQSL